MDYLNTLNEKQREAAMHIEGPLLIIAGAGSGKTSTMTRRIAYMIREKGVFPYEILAVTFTNKAALEMRERIESLVSNTKGMWMLTFHSACLRILRKYSEKIGYASDFTIYDTLDQKTVIKQSVAIENLDDKEFPVPYFQKIIGDCKDKGITAKEFAKVNGFGYKEEKVAAVYSNYEKILKKNNAFDFDDLIMRTVELFENHKDVLEEYQDRFRYIMVDEYQDTNKMQYKLIALLADKYRNVCVVGDDDQCIYQWRGADIGNILGFEKDFPGTKVIKLEQNYRSCGNILNAAYSVVKNNVGRKGKKLWTTQDMGEKIKYYRGYTEKDEASYIAKEIERLQGSQRKYADMAVLYRTHAQSRTFEEAFSLYNVPYRILGGTKFYERKEIKDIISYMKLVQNHKDDVSFKRIINEPKRGIGDKTIEKLQAFADVNDISLFDVISEYDLEDTLSAKAFAGTEQLAKVITKFQGKKDNTKISEIYDGLLLESGYIQALEEQKTVEASSRIENLMEFKGVIFDYEQDNKEATFAEFLERIVLMTDVDNHDPDENAVVLMTLHSAKGLEFPVVFMPGMEDGLFPGRRAFESFDGMEEERRLCYVGMTRAKELLYLTNAEQRNVYGRIENMRESKFLGEIDKQCMDLEEKKTKTFGSVSFIRKEENFKSREQMKYHKQPSGGTENIPQWKAGTKVSHKKFGTGMIVAIKDTTLTIVFDDAGMKQLDASIAPLEAVE